MKLRKKLKESQDKSIELMDDALNSVSQRYKAHDPDTLLQWWKLDRIIETKGASSILRRILLKPALLFAVASILLLAIAVIWLSYFSTKSYETGRGENSIIKLFDGIKVNLNYGSKLETERLSIKGTRMVTLKGEALFNVRKDIKSFIVLTEIGMVKVLGTKFNIRARENTMEVGVLEGSVKVITNLKGKMFETVVNAGHFMVCSKNGIIEPVRSIPFSEYPGWNQGKLAFYKTDFARVCSELELRFNVNVKVENLKLNELTITGVVNGHTLNDAVTILAQLVNSKYRYEKENIIFY